MSKRRGTLLGLAALAVAGLLVAALFGQAKAANSPSSGTKATDADKAGKAPAGVKTPKPEKKSAGGPKTGERPKTPKGPKGKSPKDPKAPKGIFEQRPDEHYEQGDRVDPFTLGKPVTEEPPPPPPTTPGNGGKVEPPDFWGNKLNKIRKVFRETEVLLSATNHDRFGKVISDCKKHIPTLETEITQLQKKATDAARYLYGFQAILEKFQRLQATAKRLQLKQEVEADFASKSIVVEGIVWRPRSPAAAVNGQMVTEGSVLPIGDKGAMIQVYRIRRRSVVFTYRGMQVAAQLPRGSQ